MKNYLRRRNSLSSITNSTEDSNSNSSNSVERRQQNSQISLENQKRNLLLDSNGDANKQQEWSIESKSDVKKPQEDCKKVSSSTTIKPEDNNDYTTKKNNNTTTSVEKETLSFQGKITNSSNAEG